MKYVASPSAHADGEIMESLADAYGRQVVRSMPGLGNFYRNAALALTKQEVSATPITVGKHHIANLDAVDAYLQVYNKAAANVTVGSTTPDLTFKIPALGYLDDDLFGVFSVGLTLACSTAIAATGAPTTGFLVALVYGS